MKRLGDIHFSELLPESIRHDSTVAAAAESLDRLLKRTTQAIPNLLIWARLKPDSTKMIPPMARLASAAGGLKPHSSQVLELLAWQLHVDFREVAKTDRELEKMILGSIPWHRIKGTPAAVEEGLGMFGIEALCDESGIGDNWAVYELELAAIPSEKDLLNIIRVAEEAGPKRSWLRRLHNHYDVRPIVWDVGPPLDEGFWDDDSGVWHPELGIKESYGRTSAFYIEAGQNLFAGFSHQATRPSRVFYVDRAIWDIWPYDTPVTPNYGFSRLRLHSMQSRGIEGIRHSWKGPWDKRKWNEGFSAPRRYTHYRRQLSKAEMVWDETTWDDGAKTMDRKARVLVDNPLKFDEGCWDAGQDDIGLRTVHIDELTIRRHAICLEPLSSLEAGFNFISHTD